MGELRFAVYPPERLNEFSDLNEAYVVGPDRVPWPSEIVVEDGQIVCRHRLEQSGAFYLPWPVSGHGRPVLGTATLMERDQPYHLQVELARGKVNQLRNQLAEWKAIGLAVDSHIAALVTEAQHRLAVAAVKQDEPAQAGVEAEEALTAALQAADALVAAYCEQALAVRHRQYAQFGSLLSCWLSGEPPDAAGNGLFLRSFNSAGVPFNWRLIEPAEGNYRWDTCDAQVNWCLENRLAVRGGPLLCLSPDWLPDWLWLWEGDFPNVLQFVSDIIETVVARYQGKIRLWETSARANSADVLGLSEEQLLRLTVRALEVARQIDPDGQYTIRIDQPWGCYLARARRQLSPLHFADALIRADLGVAGVNLEINMGYRPGGTAPRDLMEISRLIDLWTFLGVPLQVTLGFPSSAGPDPGATKQATCPPGVWPREWDEQAQAQWVRKCVALLLAKPGVQAVGWCHFSDAQWHEWPHAGLVRPDGSPKPALEEFARLRAAHVR
ncbi:MAG: endo-1,4-beta-xylanase [Pirellulales bacterium]